MPLNISSTSTRQQVLYVHVSGETVRYFILSVLVILGSCVSLFGVVANSLIITVFRKQGFSDKTNISLCCLATADICVSLFALADCCFLILYVAGLTEMVFNPMTVRTLLADYPRIIFSKVSSWLTAFISCERCLCVVFPFITRTAITPQNTRVAVLCLSSVVLLLHFPLYYARQLDWVFQPHINRTQLTLVVVQSRVEVYQSMSSPLFSFLPLANLFIVSLSTVILTSRVMRSSKWREQNSSADNQQLTGSSSSIKMSSSPLDSSSPSTRHTVTSSMEKTSSILPNGGKDSDCKVSYLKDTPATNSVDVKSSNVGSNSEKSKRDRKSVVLTKMITTVTLVFIICTTPSNVFISVGILYPTFSTTGRLRNLFLCCIVFCKLLEIMNSVLNIFVYYKMSSKFKATFNEIYSDFLLLFGRQGSLK